MSKWKCKTPFCIKPCYAELPENCIPQNCILDNETFPDWWEEDEPTTKCSQSVTECNQLPKLTAEVFNRPDCPEWAQWAAVDENGVAYYYAEDPCARKYTWGSWDSMKIIDGKFSSSDWKNSLIERPEKNTLPDWCKVGGYGYDYASGYFKIVEIIDCERNLKVEWVKEGVQGTVFGCNLKCKKQARLRPYNAEEMRGLVGMVICKGPSVHFVTGYENVFDGESMVHVNGCLYSANDLLRHGFTYDGKPCGVLEHLENGEWRG